MAEIEDLVKKFVKIRKLGKGKIHQISKNL